jgi:hypothetical protein
MEAIEHFWPALMISHFHIVTSSKSALASFVKCSFKLYKSLLYDRSIFKSIIFICRGSYHFQHAGLWQ